MLLGSVNGFVTKELAPTTLLSAMRAPFKNNTFIPTHTWFPMQISFPGFNACPVDTSKIVCPSAG